MISKDNAEHYSWGEQCDGWYLLKRQDLLVIHEKMPAGAAEQRHVHAVARQFFYVLSGVLTMEMEGEMHHINAMQGLEIPPGVRHQARNDADSAVEFLVISQPTTRGDRADLR